MNIRIIYVLFLLIIVSQLYAQETTIYVDSQITVDCKGNYSISERNCNGSDGDAYKNIQSAAKVAKAGTLILIRKGTYNTQLIPQNSGTPDAYIIFQNFDNEKATISGETLNPAIDLKYKNHIIVKNINVTNTRRYLDAHGASNTIVENCEFSDYAQTGSFGMVRYFDGAHNNKFINNVVSGVVPFSDVNDLLIIRNSNKNLIEGNYFDTGSHAVWAIRCGSFNIIRNNFFINRKNKIGEIYDCCETPLDNTISTEHNVIEGNIFAKSTGDGDTSPESGIQFAGQKTIIRKNIFYENLGGISLSLYPGSNCNIPGHYEAYRNYENRIYNNVFYSNHHAGIISSESISDPAAKFFDNIIKNNVFMENDLQLEQGDGKMPSWWVNYLDNKPIQFKPGRLEGFIFDNNCIATYPGQESWTIVAGERTPLVNPPTGSGSLSWWESNYPNLFRNNMETTDPLFIDKNEYDFRLKYNSPLKNSGAFLTITTNSGNNSTIMKVADANWFMDGFDIINGDSIQVEDQSDYAIIQSVDYEKNLLILDRPLSWRMRQGVSLKYSGDAPDIGALEYNAITSVLKKNRSPKNRRSK